MAQGQNLALETTAEAFNGYELPKIVVDIDFREVSYGIECSFRRKYEACPKVSSAA